jgi:hypothetical protein
VKIELEKFWSDPHSERKPAAIFCDVHLRKKTPPSPQINNQQKEHDHVVRGLGLCVVVFVDTEYNCSIKHIIFFEGLNRSQKESD